ncbi:MAG: hypothetical protein Q9190_006014 [Brigantiaea leucoxantha]
MDQCICIVLDVADHDHVRLLDKAASTLLSLEHPVSLALGAQTTANFLTHEFFKRQGCTSVQSQCDSDLSQCINYVCGNCASSSPAIESCCSLSGDYTIASCIASIADTTDTDVGSFASATPSPSVTSFFDDSTDSFASFVDEATDSFGAAASTTDLFNAIPTITSAASLASASDFPGALACSSFESVLDRCAGATPGFGEIDGFSSSASCLCYSSSTYRPRIFDGYFGSCLEYISASDPDTYTSITDEAGESFTTAPCASVGNIKAAPTGVVGGPAPTATPTSTGGAKPKVDNGNGSGRLEIRTAAGFLVSLAMAIAWML